MCLYGTKYRELILGKTLDFHGKVKYLNIFFIAYILPFALGCLLIAIY
jgi:hypothetical protein